MIKLTKTERARLIQELESKRENLRPSTLAYLQNLKNAEEKKSGGNGRYFIVQCV